MIAGNLIKGKAARALLIAQKFSPEALTVIGVVGVVASAVLASRATLKLEETVDLANERLRVARAELVTKEDKKPLVRAQTRNVLEIVKLYGPSVTLGVASLTCIVSAHGILHKRNVAIAAAYKAVEGSFEQYRKRVVEEFGEEKDTEYRQGIRTTVEKGEDGKKTTTKAFDPTDVSLYARFFDEGNPNWSRFPGQNLVFLKIQQQYMNDLLITRGHVFLNDVYDALGMERTGAGAATGWVIRKDGGDNYIDFGIYNADNEQARAFVNGNERNILLDFNVDGVIWDLI